METAFLIEYVVFAMCHAAKGDPGDLTRDRVAAMDRRLFEAFGKTIIVEARRARLTLDKRIASTIMLFATMSKFQDPRRSVPEAVAVYLNARKNEVLDESRAVFAPEFAGTAEEADGEVDLGALLPSPAEPVSGARTKRTRKGR